MEFQAGNIVVVTNPDYDRFTGKQGVIMGIIEDGNPDGPIGIRFPSWYKYLFDYPYEPDTIVRFAEEDLRKEESFIPLSPQEEAIRAVGKHYTTYSFKFPLLPGITNCMCEDCQKKAFFSVWINIYGAASNAYVCKDHAFCHGIRADDFPYKVDCKDLGEIKAEPLTKSQIVDLLFGEKREIISQKFPLVSGDNICMHEGCKKKAYFSILVAVKWKICEFHVCGEHASYHGKFIDSFPVKNAEQGKELVKV